MELTRGGYLTPLKKNNLPSTNLGKVKKRLQQHPNNSMNEDEEDTIHESITLHYVSIEVNTINIDSQ